MWAYIVGPSGIGKTTLLDAFCGSSEFIMVDSLTPNSFISGYRDENDPGKDPSLLPLIVGKTVILPDFSTVLSLRNEAQAQVFADLRRLYDFGEIVKHKGNIGLVSHTARFGLITAVTRDIERMSAEMAPLGERFISYELSLEDKVTYQQVGNKWTDSRTHIRDLFRSEVNLFLSSIDVPAPKNVSIEESLLIKIFNLADIITVWRTHVPRMRIGGSYEPCYIPMTEGPGRFSSQLQLLSKGHAAACGRLTVNKEDLLLVARTAAYCLPSWRRELLRLFVKRNVLTSKEIQETFGASRKSTDRQLENMVLLKAIVKLGKGQYGLCREQIKMIEEIGDVWPLK